MAMKLIFSLYPSYWRADKHSIRTLWLKAIKTTAWITKLQLFRYAFMVSR